MTDRGCAYWDAVCAEWERVQPQALWRAHSDAVNRALFARWLPEGGVLRLLKTDLFDEAMGEGLVALLAGRGWQAVGVDTSAKVAGDAQARRTALQAARADVRRLPFADGSFDVILSNSTLDHFAEKEEIAAGLHELRRVLRPGGELLLTLDNPANPLVALRNAAPFRLLNRLGILPYYVGATCGPGELRALLVGAGFAAGEMTAIMHCPRLLAVPLASYLQRHAAPAGQQRFLRLLAAFERLERLPTRFRTGHFVAVRARKE